MIWLVSSSWAADAACDAPFTEFDFRALVAQSDRALDKDDALTHKQLWAEFASKVPCLDHQLPKDAFARLLVDEAIVRFVAKEDWQNPLATAQLLIPDLGGIPNYLLKQAQRPIPWAWSDTVVPEDAVLFVDGEMFPQVPELHGQHVIQVWREGVWHNLWLDGLPIQAIPEAWLEPKPPKIVEVEKPDTRWVPAGRGALGLAFGVFDSRQLVEQPGTYLADTNHFGGASAVASHGVQPIASSGGVFWDGTLRIVEPSVRQIAGVPTFEAAPISLAAAYVGPGVVLEHLSFGLGGGVFQLQHVLGNKATTSTFPQAHATLAVRQARGAFDVAAGLSPSAAHASMRGGWTVGKPAPVSWGVGFEGDLGIAWFTEASLDSSLPDASDPTANRPASVVQLGVVAHFDLLWGTDR